MKGIGIVQNVLGNVREKVNQILMMVSLHSPLKARVLLHFQILLFSKDPENASVETF